MNTPPAKGVHSFTWGRDNDAASAVIRANRAPFKVILKTRNEDLLLPRWLEYYKTMLEARGSLIVLDNMSDSEKVFEIYRQYADAITLIRYEGNVDSAHSPAKFAALYQAVRDSSLFYALFDTDEFLALYDGRKILTGKRIVRFLENNADAAFFPPLYVNNVFGRDNAFVFEEKHSNTYLTSGKPILNSALMAKKLRTPVGHTRNLPFHFFQEKTPLGFVLFHLSHLSLEQRVRGNLQKLRNFGLEVDETNMARLLRANLDNPEIPPVVAFYITELRYLAGISDEGEASRQALAGDHFTVSSDGRGEGTLSFSRAELKHLFAHHADFRKNLLDILPLDPASIRTPAATLEEILASRDSGKNG